MSKKSSWKLHKFIFRLDFEPDFRLVSQFGNIANAIWNKVKDNKAEKWKIELSNDVTVSCIVESSEDKVFAQMKFGFNNATIIVEHSRGLCLQELASTKLLNAFSDFWQMLTSDFGVKISRYLRIGSRFWAIKESGCSFADVVEKFSSNMLVLQPLKDSLAINTNDLAYVFEGSDGTDNLVRIMTGPYQNAEFKKYFNFVSPEKSVGQIVDLDVSEKKQEIHNLKIFSMISAKATKAEEILCKMWQI